MRSTVTPKGASGIFRVTGYMHCLYTPQCNILGHPQSTRLPIITRTFTAPFPTLTGAVGQPHDVYGTATGITFILNLSGGNIGLGVVGTTFLVGREVARTPVPEASTVSLAALGLGIAARHTIDASISKLYTLTLSGIDPSLLACTDPPAHSIPIA